MYVLLNAADSKLGNPQLQLQTNLSVYAPSNCWFCLMSKTHSTVNHTELSKESLMFELPVPTQEFVFPHRLFCQLCSVTLLYAQF